VDPVIAEQRHRGPGLQQGLAEVRHDERRGVPQPVEDPHHARVDVPGVRGPSRCRVTAEPEQMIAFLQGETQATSERAEDLFRRARTGRLFETRVVVDRHVAEHGHLLPAQATGAAALPTGQSGVLGAQGLAPAAEVLGQARAVHVDHPFTASADSDHRRVASSWSRAER
jgi:hypothetical protein